MTTIRRASGWFTVGITGIAMLGTAGCRHAATEQFTGRGTRVLFIGNSLTSANDLPLMLAAIAAAGGHEISTDRVVADNASLADHLSRGMAAEAITRTRWDYVVLQQGPSGQIASRIELVASTERFAPIVASANGRPVLYMVWPDASRRTAFDSVSASYAAAADAVDGLLAPAGDAWQRAWQEKPSLALYGPDAFHPSQLGTYLAALAMYAVLCDRAPTSLPLRPAGIEGSLWQAASDDDLRILQRAAEAASAPLARKGQCAPRRAS
jgi:hypothetical protein